MMYLQVHELSNMEPRAPLSNNNGIRSLEDFQMVFKLKRLEFFSNCDSLRVAWLRNNIFKREKNARIFTTTVSFPEALRVSLDRLIRDRLLYILSIPESSKERCIVPDAPVRAQKLRQVIAQRVIQLFQILLLELKSLLKGIFPFTGSSQIQTMHALPHRFLY
uniref:Uncharacterized protein n=1 Tax=Brassica oleracea var. oleracea TaxID=109376 RepID=A0A0D3ABG5_BRAOL